MPQASKNTINNDSQPNKKVKIDSHNLPDAAKNLPGVECGTLKANDMVSVLFMHDSRWHPLKVIKSNSESVVFRNCETMEEYSCPPNLKIIFKLLSKAEEVNLAASAAAAPAVSIEAQLRQQEQHLKQQQSLMLAEAKKLESLRFQAIEATTNKILHISQQYEDCMKSTAATQQQIQKDKEQIDAIERNLQDDLFKLILLKTEQELYAHVMLSTGKLIIKNLAEINAQIKQKSELQDTVQKAVTESVNTDKSFEDLNAIFAEEISKLISNCGKHSLEEVKAAYPDNIAPLEKSIAQIKAWQEKQTSAKAVTSAPNPVIPQLAQNAVDRIPVILNQFNAHTVGNTPVPSSSSVPRSSPVPSSSRVPSDRASPRSHVPWMRLY